MSSVSLESVSDNDPNLKKGIVRSTASRPLARNDPGSPDFRSEFYIDQFQRWKMIDTLWNGTDAMRAAGETYMPRYEQEVAECYDRRLNSATLLNYFRRTVQGYVGKPFGKPMSVPPDLPPGIAAVLQDLDGRGINLDMFAQRAFEGGVSKGLVHALIDFPPVNDDATAADEAQMQATVVLIQPENLLGARCDAQGKLEQVRILECRNEADGQFGEKTVERIRVIERDSFTVFRCDGKKWFKESEGVNTLGEISLVSFLADEEGFMLSRPPLLDLAYKNIEHWQSSSDQRNVLTVARFPILFGTGINPSDPLTIGPNTYYGMRDPSANLRFVEHGGSAIGAGRQDLEDLKSEMAILGLSLLLPSQSGDMTATAKAIDGAESVTELQRIVLVFENFLNEVCYWIARWSGMAHDQAYILPKVRVNNDWSKLIGIDAGLGALITARTGRDISRGALLEAMKRRNILPADFDAEVDAEALSEEGAQTGDGLPPRQPFGRRF